MKFNKNLLAAGIVTTVAAGSLIGTGMASAQSSDGADSIIDKIATRFNLDKSEVETTFSEHREERQVERQEKHTEHLASLVIDGTLTQAQADALTAKHTELREARDALKDQDLTREEMHEAMETAREEMKTWAEEQGIDLDAIRPEGGHKGGRHHGPRGESDS